MLHSIERANAYVRNNKQEANPLYKPAFHFSAEIGWINDPNGLSFYGGQYHLFYQYHPYSSKNASMYWGHAVSDDLVKWTHLPVALAPDRPYDANGCFSGSAIETDGRHVIMYTGHVDPDPNDPSLVRQTQCIAIGDGIVYEKLAANPVLTGDDLPEGASVQDFRDPKLWKQGDQYYAAIGSRAIEKVGQILLYRSADLKNWTYVGVLLKGNPKLGHMWECPDFFALDGKHVLILSPQRVERDGYRYHNQDAAVFMTGEFDYGSGRFVPIECDELDYGFDYFAPQTMTDDKGRTILIGWMQSWNRSIPVHELGHRWSGMMTLPRELTLEGNRIIQRPIREIEAYRSNPVQCRTEILGETKLAGVEGAQAELLIAFERKNASRFGLKVRQGGSEETLLYYDATEGVFSLDRSRSGYDISAAPDEQGVNGKRSVPVSLRDNMLTLRIFLDRSSVEAFINDGERTMSATIYPSATSTGITFFSDGEVAASVEKWDIVKG